MTVSSVKGTEKKFKIRGERTSSIMNYQKCEWLKKRGGGLFTPLKMKID